MEPRERAEVRVKRWWARVLESHLLSFLGAAVVGIFVWILIAPIVGAATFTGVPASDYLGLEAEIQTLQNRLNTVELRASNLETRVQSLSNVAIPQPLPAVPNTGVDTTYPYHPTPVVTPVVTHPAPVETPNYGPLVIDQNGGEFTADRYVYFTGRGFAPFETILITAGGVLVDQARADGAGGFSNRGTLVSLGTHTYVFSGQESGRSAVATIRGVRDILSQ